MNECLNNFKMAGGITRKDLNQWQTWNARVKFKLSEYNTGRELQVDRLYHRLGVKFGEDFRTVLRKSDGRKLKRRLVTSGHIYKKRLNELDRIKTIKRSQRKKPHRVKNHTRVGKDKHKH